MGLTLVGGGEAPGGDGGDGAAPRHRHVVEAEDVVLGAGVKHRAGEHHRLVTLAWGDTENVKSVPNTAIRRFTGSYKTIPMTFASVT